MAVFIRGTEIVAIRIRNADPGEVDVLTEIAHRAKRHWGYPEAWIRLWKTDLTYTDATLRESIVIVAERDRVCGVASLSVDHSRTAEIEGLWVDPDSMGRGVGRALFNELARRARAAGAEAIRIASDPQAEGFYLRMGAVRVGSVKSGPSGRMLPELWFRLEEIPEPRRTTQRSS